MRSDLAPPALHPLDLKQRLDEHVVGQERAKVELSVLFSMHLHWFRNPHPIHRAPNGLLIGPTGVGKTFTIQRACEQLELPFTAVDATSLVPSGIVGMQAEDILEDLTDAALVLVRQTRKQEAEPAPDNSSDRDDASDLLARVRLRESAVERTRDAEVREAISLAEKGVVFLDEIDKLAKDEDSTSNERAQRRLLRLTDGGIMSIGTRDYRAKYQGQTLDTTGILFLAGGAFDGIRESRIRSGRPTSISRGLPNSNDVIPADVINYGFLPELVGRFPTLIEFDNLEASDLLGILRHPEVSPLLVWKRYFEALGLSFEIDSDVENVIVDRARTIGLGARGLQQLIFPQLSRAVYECLCRGDTTVDIPLDWLVRRSTLSRDERKAPIGTR